MTDKRESEHIEDLDVSTSSDRRTCRCRKRLDCAVVRQGDGAVSALANAHDDSRCSADQFAKGRGLTAFGTPQSRKYRERHEGAGYTERERDARLPDRTQAKRDRPEEPADAEHREKAKEDRRRGRIFGPRHPQERDARARDVEGGAKAHAHAPADA